MRLPLPLKGLLWRGGTSIAILITAAVTTGAAALGPIYALSASESTLRDVLTEAPAQNSGLQFEQTYETTGKKGSALHQLAETADLSPKPGSIRGYPHATETIYWESEIEGATTGIVWKPDACEHLTFNKGHCATTVGEAIISERTVETASYDLKLGSRLSLDSGQTVTVVGIYTPKNSGSKFWFGENYFDAAPGTLSTPDVLDTVFVPKAEFAAMRGREVTRDGVEYALDPAQIRLANIPVLKAEVNHLESLPRVNPRTDALRPVLTTGLDGVIANAAHEQQLVDTGTLLVTLQLTLLGWLVLFQVVADAVESRGAEIALAKLRGHSVARTLRFGLGEPLVLLLVAIPIGVALAYAAAEGFAGSVLVPGTPVALTWGTLAATLAAFAGGLVAAGLAARRVLVRSVLEQWRRTTKSRPHTRAALVVDIVVATLAVAGLVYLRVSGAVGSGDDTLALLAPGLLVLAVALVGTRLMPLAVRLILPLTRATTAVSMFIASRQVVRRPTGLRLAALLAVALGLATFGVGAEAVSAENRTARAQAEFGAAQVVSFEYNPTVDPINAVKKADPDGAWAMAAATWLPDGGNSVTGTVLGVDATRLGAIAYSAQGGESSAQLSSTISASTEPVIVLRATTIAATIDASGLRKRAIPQVQFNLVSNRGALIDAESTLMLTGKHQYTASIPCSAGCTFLGLTWDRPITTNDRIVGRATVSSIRSGTGGALTAVNARLTTPGAWRTEVPSGNASDHVTDGSAGATDEFSSHDGGYGGMIYAYVPVPLPAVVSPTGIVPQHTAHPNMSVVDNFGAEAHFAPVATVGVLPKVLDGGLVMNLAYLQNELPDFNNEANWEVWLSPSAPSDAVAKLRAAGITVQSVAKESTRVAELARQGPALSLLLLLSSAIAGSILAIGGTAISIGSSARRRSYESAALGTIGVSRSQLYRAALYEQGFVLGTAVVLGVVSGIVAALITLPIVPEFASSTPVQLDYAPSPLVILLSTLAFIVVVAAAAAITSAGVLREARAGRLREAEE